jgi:GT2 family glycosyltransferase
VLFRSIKGFDDGFFLHVEDLDICYRFREEGGEIYFAPDIRITHVGGTSDVPSLFIERCKAKSFSYYFRRNFMDRVPLPVLWLLDAAIWGRYGLIVAKTKFLLSKKKA